MPSSFALVYNRLSNCCKCDPHLILMPADKIPLSVVIIAKNAATQIASCIDSVAFAEEILVVDSGSQDETRAIAEVRGCRVI